MAGCREVSGVNNDCLKCNLMFLVARIWCLFLTGEVIQKIWVKCGRRFAKGLWLDVQPSKFLAIIVSTWQIRQPGRQPGRVARGTRPGYPVHGPSMLCQVRFKSTGAVDSVT
jgi:hypothetical protein